MTREQADKLIEALRYLRLGGNITEIGLTAQINLINSMVNEEG